LPALPAVVLNAPSREDMAPRATDRPDLRSVCGLDSDTPLIVYSGAAAPQRGLGTMIEAMPSLPGVHVALVVKDTDAPYVVGLARRAIELGVVDRLHLTNYVPPADVVSYLASATAGVIPIEHWLNHEISLVTKFFEYSHARLPIIVSDVKTMAAQVHATGQGEVFRADDVKDYVRAVQAVVADQKRYRDAYDVIDLDIWTWESQAAMQDVIYRQLSAATLHPQSVAPDVERELDDLLAE
jgi:glycosyltransferase involved in cell wall biosynthesis